ncbi:unnamed protein product [Rotaria magnacalcarata]
MHQSIVDILALSDEMLLAILNKLNNIDVLFSLIGVNKKLDRLAQDINFTRSIDLVRIISNEKNSSSSRTNSILDRFCFDILPRIQHNIECLTLDSLSIDRVLRIGNYPKLNKLNLELEMTSPIFNNEPSFIHIFKHQILHLNVTINENITAEHLKKLSTNIFTTIFTMFTNLNYLHFDLKDDYLYSPPFINSLSSRNCFSSNIAHVNVRLRRLNDCLGLLNEDFNQLHTFIVKIDRIYKTSMIINNTKTVSNLKCFSLSSFIFTIEYDTQIVPLIHQMLQLENLTLNLLVRGRNSFIDGTHLTNDVLCKIPNLHTFIFNIITHNVIMDEEFLPTSDDVERALIQRAYNVGSCTDYCPVAMGQCHIYSLPFTMSRLETCTNKFPAGLFISVRHLVVRCSFRPFEHDFFVRVSQACPLLNKLTVTNKTPQKKKLTYQQSEHEQTTSIIEFSHLMILNLCTASLDYVEQFLFDFNTRLPCLNTLHIQYRLLEIVTQYFTNNTTRAHCSKLQHIIFDCRTKIYPENFYPYFPLLQK